MKELYRYESAQRPVSIGTHPKKGVVEIWNYTRGMQAMTDIDDRTILSWGYIVYNRKLTDKEMSDYELTYAGEVFAG